MQTLDEVNEMLGRIGGYLGTKLALDDRGMASLSYAGDRTCVLAVQPGLHPRMGMAASLIPAATDDQIARAMLMNATLERESGVLALDDTGALILTAARDAANLSETDLASFMSDFINVSIELVEALRTPDAGRGPEGTDLPDNAMRC